MRHLIIATCLMVVVGCADTHTIIPNTTYSPTTLSADGTAYIALPADRYYGKIDYVGSGAMVARMLQTALMDHMAQVDIGSAYQQYASARKSARQGGYTYFFFPTITHWEDRETAWSGTPDKAALRLVVIDVASGDPVASATIEGTSGMASMGSDHPQDLLSKPIQKYVDQLFRG